MKAISEKAGVVFCFEYEAEFPRSFAVVSTRLWILYYHPRWGEREH